MSLPALSMSVPDDELRLWSHPRVADLLPVFFPDRKVCTGSRMDAPGMSRLLLMTDSFRSALQGLLSGFRERTGYATDMRRLLLTKALRPPGGRYRHHSEDYIELARAAGMEGAPAIPPPAVDPNGEPHIAMFPGARFGPAKKWHGFSELARCLNSETGLPVVMYGSNEESSEIDLLCSEIPCCTSETGLPLPELVSRLLAAELAVGNDSGGVHLSAAVGIPTLSVFGSTSPVWTSPMGRMTSVITSGMDCSPCYRKTCPRGAPDCLSSISTESVLRSAVSLISKDRRKEGIR